jgi:acetolactate synthase small subunit
MYKVKDAVHLFQDGNSLVIIDYLENKMYRVDYQRTLVDLFVRLMNWSSVDSLVETMPVSRKNVEETIRRFLDLDIFVEQRPVKDNLTIAILGLGTTGSHIFKELSKLEGINTIVLIDNDRVEVENIDRQAFIESEIGLYKIDALAQRRGRIGVVKKYYQRIDSSDELLNICRENRVDILIHAADFPSTREIAKIVEKIGNILNIPYIINFGYISNVINVPEFYYPNQEYRFSVGHQALGYKLLVSQVQEKVSYRFAEAAAIVVAQQIVDFQNGRQPAKYGERGFFHVKTCEWETDDYFDKQIEGE